MKTINYIWLSGGTVDTRDLKSLGPQWLCEFDSRLGYSCNSSTADKISHRYFSKVKSMTEADWSCWLSQRDGKRQERIKNLEKQQELFKQRFP